MGRHINERGEFQSDKYPDLAPDRIVLSFKDPRAWPSLTGLARRYEDVDPEFSRDILMRLETVEYGSQEGESDEDAPPEGHPHRAGRHADISAQASRRAVGRHINERGEFQSDKYPDLGPDRLVLSFRDIRAWPSLMGLARRYEDLDPEFSRDIRTRLQTIRLVED